MKNKICEYWDAYNEYHTKCHNWASTVRPLFEKYKNHSRKEKDEFDKMKIIRREKERKQKKTTSSSESKVTPQFPHHIFTKKNQQKKITNFFFKFQKI